MSGVEGDAPGAGLEKIRSRIRALGRLPFITHKSGVGLAPAIGLKTILILGQGSTIEPLRVRPLRGLQIPGPPGRVLHRSTRRQ
jgi:hypothetical protein